MGAKESAHKLRAIIEKAIDDEVITRAEYEKIMDQAMADFVIDAQERALLSQLQDMIEQKIVKLVP